MKSAIFILTLTSLISACGDSSSGSKHPMPSSPPIELAQTKTDTALYKAVKANFQGKYVGVLNGQLLNFDENKKPGAPVQFVYEHVEDSSRKLLEALPQRPQRIDILNDDYVLLQRPQYYFYDQASYKSTEFPQDCFLINVKTGKIWRFDEYFPYPGTLQFVSNGSSQKLLFIGIKKLPEGKVPQSWNYVDLAKEYNYSQDKVGSSQTFHTSSKKTLISIDLSDKDQVTLRPISSGLDHIEHYIADQNGNVLAQSSQNTQRTLAILQTDGTPTEVAINNANFTESSSYDSRIVADSKKNFWRLTKSYTPSFSGRIIKAERLSLTRDLNNRPTLLPLMTLTQEIESSSDFRIDGKYWSYSYQDNEVFALTGTVVIANAEQKRLKTSTFEGGFSAGGYKSEASGFDPSTGKILTYLSQYAGSLPVIHEFDLADELKARSIQLDIFGIFGDINRIENPEEGYLEIESQDGPVTNTYRYDGKTGNFQLKAAVKADVDHRIRILAPVNTID